MIECRKDEAESAVPGDGERGRELSQGMATEASLCDRHRIGQK